MEQVLSNDMLNEIYNHSDYITKCVLKFVNKMYYNKSFKVNIRKIISMLNNNLLSDKNGLPSFCWKRVIETHFQNKCVDDSAYDYIQALYLHKMDDLSDEIKYLYEEHTFSGEFFRSRESKFKNCQFEYNKLINKIEDEGCCEFVTQYPNVDLVSFGHYYIELYHNGNDNDDIKLDYLKDGHPIYREKIFTYKNNRYHFNHNKVNENGDIIFKDPNYDPSMWRMKKLYGQYSFHKYSNILYDKCYDKYIRLEPIIKKIFDDCISSLSTYDINIHHCKIPVLFRPYFFNNSLTLASEHVKVLFNNYPVQKYKSVNYHECVKYKTWIGKIHNGNIILYEISLTTSYYDEDSLIFKINPKKTKMRRLDALLIYPIKGILNLS